MPQPAGAVRNEFTRVGANAAHTRCIRDGRRGGDRRNSGESGDKDGKSVETHIAAAGNGQWQAETENGDDIVSERAPASMVL